MPKDQFGVSTKSAREFLKLHYFGILVCRPKYVFFDLLISIYIMSKLTFYENLLFLQDHRIPILNYP